MNVSRDLIKLLFIGLAIPVLGSAISIAWFDALRFDHFSVHAIIETVGSVTALAVILLLLHGGHFARSLGTEKIVWIASALAAMGILDAFHAFAPVGNNFVWLHSLATLAGGVLFACIWLSKTQYTPDNRILYVVVGLAVFVGMLSFQFPQRIPAMVVDNQFTLTARAINIIGGAGFIIATAFMFIEFKRTNLTHYYCLASHCLLFGSAGILFELSSLWDMAWWWWHALRLAAYLVLIYFFIAEIETNKAPQIKECQANQQQSKSAAIFSNMLISCVTLISISVLFGWYTNNTDIIQVLPSFAPMQFNTALCFFLCSIGGLTIVAAPAFSRVLGLSVAFFAALSFSQYTFNINLGIDELFVDGAVMTKTSHPGRMAPNTAICFILAGLALATMRTRQLSVSLTVGVAVLSMAAFTGYGMNAEGFYGLGSLTRMAVHTATGFALLSVAFLIRPNSIKHRNTDIWALAPFITGAVLFSLTVLIWNMAKETNRYQMRQHLESLAYERTSEIEKRFAFYEHALLGGVGFFEGSSNVDRSEWRAYVDSLNLSTYLAGSNGIGFIDAVDAGDLSSYLDAARADDSENFVNHPHTEANDKFIIRYIEPIEINREAVGLDIGFESHRRHAAEHARDTGKITLTDIIYLVQDDKKMPGFLLLAPLYKKNASLSSVEDRRRNIKGWVYSPFMARKFFSDLTDTVGQELALTVHDGEIHDTDKLAFDSWSASQAHAGGESLEKTVQIELAEQTWTILFRPTNAFNPNINRELPSVVLVVGTIVSILAAAFFQLLSRLYGASARLADENRRRLDSVVNNAVAGIITLDEQGLIESFNKSCESIFGYTRDEVIGKNISILMPDRYREAHDGYIQNYVDSGQSKIIGVGRELEGLRKNGGEFPMELSVSQIRLSDRVIFSGIIADISERKSFEQEREKLIGQLERSNTELDNFAHIASHDLKEPLRAISNHAHFLKEDYEGTLDEDGVKRLSRLIYLSKRMEKLVSDLLNFSRLGREEMAIKQTDLNIVITDIAETMQDRLHERGATIVVNEALPSIKCDTVRVTELFRNLIGNGIKYNEDNSPEIEVGCINGSGRAFYVKDNGIGIPQEFHADIFRIFKRLNSEDRFGEGTGAGLTFVKKIVEQHGGRIWIESVEGEGTTVFFTLSEADQ